MSREYDKLVRDDIPEIIRESGETPVTHVADGDEFDRRLREKLVEEADEFAVVDAILDRCGEDWETIEAMADEKAGKRGGFEDGVVLERVE